MGFVTFAGRVLFASVFILSAYQDVIRVSAALVVLAYNLYKITRKKYPNIFNFNLREQGGNKTKKFCFTIILVVSYLIATDSIFKAIKEAV